MSQKKKTKQPKQPAKLNFSPNHDIRDGQIAYSAKVATGTREESTYNIIPFNNRWLLNIDGFLNKDMIGNFNVVQYDHERLESITAMANFIYRNRENKALARAIDGLYWKCNSLIIDGEEVTEHILMTPDASAKTPSPGGVYKVSQQIGKPGVYNATYYSIQKSGKEIHSLELYCRHEDLNSAKATCMERYYESWAEIIKQQEKDRKTGKSRD